MESKRRPGKAGLVAWAIGAALFLSLWARPADAFYSVARGSVSCSQGLPLQFTDGGTSSQFALISSGTQTLPGCEGEAEVESFASQSRGVLKATSTAGGTYTAASSAVVETSVRLFGPRNARMVTDTFELVITGTATSPYQGFVTSAWTGCIVVALADGTVVSLPSCIVPTYGNGSPITQTLTLEYTTPVVNGQTQLLVDFSLGTNAYGTVDDLGNPVFGSANLGDTAYIVHRLPPGWTATYDPDIFLSESTVPEPAQGVQLGSALATLALLHLVRRSR